MYAAVACGYYLPTNITIYFVFDRDYMDPKELKENRCMDLPFQDFR